MTTPKMNPDSSVSSPLTTVAQQKLVDFYQLGLQCGCPRDQLFNLANAGQIMQVRQLLACAAARLCDQPDGPRAVGYGGARGGGKTHWLLAQMGADDCQRVPGLRCLLLRKVGKSNSQNLEDYRQRLFARLDHEYSTSRGELKFANGSQIRLGHYQCEKDIDAYLGQEYDIIGIEEATQLTQRKYEDICTCCRTSKTNWRPRIYATTNPGDVGHQWFLNTFILPYQSRNESATRFIPARVEDNAFIDPEYKARLKSLTGWQHTAWYEGGWGVNAGQYFRTFNPLFHVLPDNFPDPCGAEWFAAMDYGYNHPTVALLACRDAADNLYVLDEHIARFWITQHLREHLLARYPHPCTERDNYWNLWQKRKLLAFVAGADVFSRESTGESVARQYEKLGLHLQPANTHRVSGWSAINDLLGDPDAGIPARLFIHPRCCELLACLPRLQHDPDLPGDVLKTNINEAGEGGDDAADALRYLVTYHPRRIHVRKLTGF